jgi:hypothetical protein
VQRLVHRLEPHGGPPHLLTCRLQPLLLQSQPHSPMGSPRFAVVSRNPEVVGFLGGKGPDSPCVRQVGASWGHEQGEEPGKGLCRHHTACGTAHGTECV